MGNIKQQHENVLPTKHENVLSRNPCKYKHKIFDTHTQIYIYVVCVWSWVPIWMDCLTPLSKPNLYSICAINFNLNLTQTMKYQHKPKPFFELNWGQTCPNWTLRINKKHKSSNILKSLPLMNIFLFLPLIFCAFGFLESKFMWILLACYFL